MGWSLHRHHHLTKEGLGDVTICYNWRGRTIRVMFRPDYDGARFHDVPEDKYEAVVDASSPAEAMAILRG